MANRLSSPPLIKGINGIVSRSPNEVNYSTLIEKNTETRNQPGKEKSRKYKKYERSGNMAKDVKNDENEEKITILREPGNRNDEGNKGEGLETEAEAEADTKADTTSEVSKNNGNTGDVKQVNTGKNGYVVEPGKENKAEMMKKDVGLDGDEDGVTTEAQQQKCENPAPNTKIETIFGKVTHVVEGLHNDQVDDAKAMMAKAARQGQ